MQRLTVDRKNLPADFGAAVTMALVAVPDAIASAIVAGVNPTYGFNALIIGTPVGSLFTSSEFMNIGSTAAMMLAVGGVLAGYAAEEVLTALITLTVLILRMHGRARIGSTFVQILERYATRIKASGGKLLLSGVSQRVWDQLARTETFAFIPQEDVFKSTQIMGESTAEALRTAQAWLAGQKESAETVEEPV